MAAAGYTAIDLLEIIDQTLSNLDNISVNIIRFYLPGRRL
jgi:uncharacterized protein HemX